MIPLTFLCHEYIDRPKLTEQKKSIWVYIVPPPHKWGRNKSEKLLENILGEIERIFLKLGTLIIIAQKQ